MTKQEIIEVTLQKIEYKRNPPPDEIADCVGIEGYDDFVIAELFEQLPQGEIRTCEDFEYLNVECCEICHRYYPHFDMRLETLSDGSKAWICCQVRSALLDPEARVAELPEYVDMESVFAALLPNVGIVFVHAGCLWVDSTPVDDAILYGEVLTHDKGHDVFWGELQARSTVPKDVEYDEVPRGRVCYNTRSRIYHLYLDRCVLRDKEMVRKIMRSMKLPSAPPTEINTDPRYRCPGCLLRSAT